MQNDCLNLSLCKHAYIQEASCFSTHADLLSFSYLEPKITVTKVSDAIELSCSNGQQIAGNGRQGQKLKLSYDDNNSGEYECLTPPADNEHPDNPGTETVKIYVKFRSCDNCIELDEGSVAGLVVGNVVATIVIGVAVYLVVTVSQTRTPSKTSNKKSSDRQQLIRDVSPRPTDEPYQRLNLKGVQRDTYDELHNHR